MEAKQDNRKGIVEKEVKLIKRDKAGITRNEAKVKRKGKKKCGKGQKNGYVPVVVKDHKHGFLFRPINLPIVLKLFEI